MTRLLNYISLSLTRRIGAGILLGVLVIFVVAMGLLFSMSRAMVKQEAYGHAGQVLDNASRRVEILLNEVEVATANVGWQALAHLHPDSLLAYSRAVVEQNPNVNSCSVTTEPDFFPQSGRYFSAYTERRDSDIVTVREGEYDYCKKVWYKAAREAGKPVWVEPFDDYNAGTLSADDVKASYCVPIYTADGRFVGVIATDISLPTIAKAVTLDKPYPESYIMMLGRDGHYLVHPEEDRLMKTTIFDEVDPSRQPGLITLDHEMLDGKQGFLDVEDFDVTYHCFYGPIPQTGWSVAIVCTDSDIFGRYNRLTYIVVPLLLVGLLLMLVYCRRTVNRLIAPLQQLSKQARRIADGHFDEHMSQTQRADVVGRLQNNFVAMQHTLDEHVRQLQAVNAESERRNCELAEADRLAAESGRQKMAFLQDMTHQIRTPLNIIMGFAQVLRDNFGAISGSEVESIADTMQQNATSVNRMVNMLLAAAAVADNHEKVERCDVVNVMELARHLETVFNNRPPRRIPLTIDSQVPDGLTILTSRDYLTMALNELLYNAKKFTTEGTITLRLRQDGSFVRFIVEDTGPGIAPEDRDRVFTRFQKLDDFGEGLGLGLSITLQFAQMLGGTLTLDKDYIGGSRFVLELPREL